MLNPSISFSSPTYRPEYQSSAHLDELMSFRGSWLLLLGLLVAQVNDVCSISFSSLEALEGWPTIFNHVPVLCGGIPRDFPTVVQDVSLEMTTMTHLENKEEEPNC